MNMVSFALSWSFMCLSSELVLPLCKINYICYKEGHSLKPWFLESLHEHLKGWLQYICYRALKLQYQTNFLYRLKQYLHIFYCEQNWPRNMTLCKFQNINVYYHYFLTASSIVVECWRRVRVSGSIPSQGPRHTNDVIKMVAKAVVQHCYPWWRPRWSP